MESKYYWLIWGVVGVFLFLGALFSYNFFYDMQETNCKSITSTRLDVSTDKVVECKKFYNYPSWNFTIPYWLIWGMLHGFIGLILLMINYE